MTLKRVFAAAAVITIAMAPAAMGYAPTDPESQRCVDTDNAQGNNATVFAQGEAIRISGAAGCAKVGQSVPIYIQSDPILLGTPTADGNGNYTLLTTIPAGIAPGTHTIIIDVDQNGPASGNNYQKTITVVAGTSVTLPKTGSDTSRLGSLGASVLALGLALVLAVGSRRTRTS